MNASHQLLSKEVLASLDLKILAVQRTRAGTWWNYHRVISPFSRLWLVLDGAGSVRHHDQEFALSRGRMHLVPAFTVHDCVCPRRLDHYHLHFVARLPTGIDLFSLLECDFQINSPAEMK